MSAGYAELIGDLGGRRSTEYESRFPLLWCHSHRVTCTCVETLGNWAAPAAVSMGKTKTAAIAGDRLRGELREAVLGQRAAVSGASCEGITGDGGLSRVGRHGGIARRIVGDVQRYPPCETGRYPALVALFRGQRSTVDRP